MNTTLTQTSEQLQTAKTAEQDTVTELNSAELAYVGGGMGILCWG